MTNAKYSLRNYIIVKRRSIAHVLYLIHAKGSLYQFFSREGFPEVYVQTHDPSIKSLRRLLSKTGLFLGVSEIILLKSRQINGYFWILIRVFTGTPEIETSSAWWISKSYESRHVGSLLFLPQKRLSHHGPLRFVTSHSRFALASERRKSEAPEGEAALI